MLFSLYYAKKFPLDSTFPPTKHEKNIAFSFLLSIIGIVLYFLKHSYYEKAGLHQGSSRKIWS